MESLCGKDVVDCGIFEETKHVSISVIACDTEKVTDMGFMFFKCSSLTKLELEKNFNTENVTNMAYMFNYCQNLTELEIVEKFNITNVLNRGGMFKNCNENIENKILGEDK